MRKTLIELYRLSRIVSGICNDVYSIHPHSKEDRLAHSENWTAKLKAWKDTLPAFLEPNKVDPSILVPIFQRQSTVLTLAYAHALILTNRQFLLSNFIDLTRPESTTNERVEFHIQECVEAALVAVNTVSDFVEHGMLYRTFWFSQYISFCAIATLYVYTIRRFHTQRTNLDQVGEDADDIAPKRGYMECFEAAEKCRTLIASKTEHNSPSRRYSIILDELKRQVLAELEGTSAHLNVNSTRKPANQYRVDVSNEDQSALPGKQVRFVQNDSQVHHPFGYTKFDGTDTGVSSTDSLLSAGEPLSTMDFPILADSALDNGQWDLPFDAIGWPELDSWVSGQSFHVIDDYEGASRDALLTSAPMSRL